MKENLKTVEMENTNLKICKPKWKSSKTFFLHPFFPPPPPKVFLSGRVGRKIFDNLDFSFMFSVRRPEEEKTSGGWGGERRKILCKVCYLEWEISEAENGQ